MLRETRYPPGAPQIRYFGAAHLPLIVLLWLLSACAPSESDLAYQRGLNAVAEQKFDWARRYFSEDLQSNPDRLASLRHLGIAWRSGTQQSLYQATQAFRRYLAQQPADAEIQLLLAWTLFLAGEWQEAQSWAKRLDHTLEACLFKAELYLDSNPQAAQTAITNAVQQDPHNAKVHTLAARVALRIGDRQASLKHAQQAARLGSQHPKTYYVLARLWRQNGALERAQEALDTHQLLSKLAHPPTAAGLSTNEELQLVQALEKRLPTIPYTLRQRKLRLLFEAGQTDHAIQELKRLLVHPETTVRARLNFASLAETGGRPSLAQRLYAEVLAESPTEDLTDRHARSGLARLAYRSGDLETVQRLMTEGLGQEPHLARYHYLQGLAVLSLGNPAEAKQHLSSAVRLAPWESEWRGELAEVYLAEGERERAVAILNDAPLVDPRLEHFKTRHGLS